MCSETGNLPCFSSNIQIPLLTVLSTYRCRPINGRLFTITMPTDYTSINAKVALLPNQITSCHFRACMQILCIFEVQNHNILNSLVLLWACPHEGVPVFSNCDVRPLEIELQTKVLWLLRSSQKSVALFLKGNHP
jgi:hypothetical protein